MANILPPFPSFSVHEDDTSISPRWKKWLKRFQMYLAAHDGKDATRKRAPLLYSAGEEVSDIFETLPDQGEEKEYEKAVAGLDVYFQPKVDKTYVFGIAAQNVGESLDSYCTRLRRRAQTCEFTTEDEEIKSQIVVSCLSSRLYRRALSRHESQSSTRLRPGSRNVRKASQRHRRIREVSQNIGRSNSQRRKATARKQERLQMWRK